MEFTFTDYTFSGLLSILAALYGIGYPLIIQSIEKIGVQYNSERISKKFLEEPIYVFFQVLLVINLVCAIATPFILHAGWNNIRIITVQVVLLVFLIGQTFLLFRLILRFSSAPDLLKHLEGRAITKKNVHHIFDLAVYADEKHLLSLYNACMADVFRYVYAQQGDKKGSLGGVLLPAPEYNKDTFDLAYRIQEYLRKDDGHHYMYGHNSVVAAFYNQFSSSRIGLDSRKIMWQLANEAIAFDNRSWFLQYWQIADGYASIKYQFVGSGQRELYDDRREFQVQHVMTGASLAHWKRYDWLNDIFFYTHSEPEYYGLIPSTFSEIIVSLRRLALQCDNPMAGGWKYYFSDSMAGATDEHRIFREAVRYLSLLVIRLWSMKGRNFMNWGDVMQTPALPLLLTDEQQEINQIGMMKNDVEEWMNRDVFKLMPNLITVDAKTVIDFLDSYKKECEKDYRNKQEHPTVNRKKYEELYGQFTEAVESLIQSLPNQGKHEGGMSITMDIRHTEELETINYSSFRLIDCSCVPSAVCINFWKKIALDYLGCLDRQKRLGDFSVPRKQIQNVLRAMGLDEKYAIITTEKMDEIGDGATNLYALLLVKWFFVVKKDELPRMELASVEELAEIKPGSGVCSNIEGFQGYNDPVYPLVLGTKFRFSLPNGFTGYVRFTVDDTYEAQDVKISPKQTFDELFGIKQKGQKA